MSRYDFNKAAKDMFRTSFLKNNSGGLLLQVLKGLRNHNGKLFFFVGHKNRLKHNQHFKVPVFQVNSHFGT